MPVIKIRITTKIIKLKRLLINKAVQELNTIISLGNVVFVMSDFLLEKEDIRLLVFEKKNHEVNPMRIYAP